MAHTAVVAQAVATPACLAAQYLAQCGPTNPPQPVEAETAQHAQPVAIAAQAAARQLKAEAGPGLEAKVQAVLVTGSAPQQHAAQAPGETSSTPQQEQDLVALAALIVDTASLALTAYGLMKSLGEPSAEMIATDVSLRLMGQGRDAPDHIIKVVVSEVIRAVSDQERANARELEQLRAELAQVRADAARERDEADAALESRGQVLEELLARAERDLDATRAELAKVRQEPGEQG